MDDSIIHITTRQQNLIKNFFKPEVWPGLYRYYFNRDNFYSWVYNDMMPYIGSSSAVLSVGGDNYSLDYGVPTGFIALDDIVYKQRKPMILWGASVGPFSAMPGYESYMSDHLRNITGIFARETATIEYLKSIGVKDNVYYFADPAFLMDPVKPSGIDDEMPIDKNSIGINISPLMAKWVTGGNLDHWIQISADIIETIGKITDLPIYLIPHVTMAGSNDYLFMQKALSQLHQKNKKITLVPPVYNAAETKWIISQMAFFAGARTHSTIAALSSSVPTLSFAYSIKAQGINKDLFGHTDYCINPIDMDIKTISNKILFMLDQDTVIRKELDKRIPEIMQSAIGAGTKLQRIIEEKKYARSLSCYPTL